MERILGDDEERDETLQERYERLGRREPEYYYKHFAHKIYSKGLLEEHFGVFDFELNHPDEVQGCCPQCCANVRRTCFIFGIATVACWIPFGLYLLVYMSSGLRLHDEQLESGGPEEMAFLIMLIISFILDVGLAVTLIIAAKRRMQIMAVGHIIGGSIQVFLFLTEGLLVASALGNKPGLESTVYLLIFVSVASRTLYFTIESYGLYLYLEERQKRLGVPRGSGMTIMERPEEQDPQK